jgi:hypothetical protein
MDEKPKKTAKHLGKSEIEGESVEMFLLDPPSYNGIGNMCSVAAINSRGQIRLIQSIEQAFAELGYEVIK